MTKKEVCILVRVCFEHTYDVDYVQIEDSARHLILKYSQGYVKDTVKVGILWTYYVYFAFSFQNRIIFPTRASHGVSEYVPKHCRKQQCICQFIDKVRLLYPLYVVLKDSFFADALQSHAKEVVCKICIKYYVVVLKIFCFTMQHNIREYRSHNI